MDALIVAGVALLALWLAGAAARRRSGRRAERRADEARARAQARRPPVPVVSSNLRGQSAAAQDLWQAASRAAEPADAPAPADASAPDR
jgi:hypothetical protein